MFSNIFVDDIRKTWTHVHMVTTKCEVEVNKPSPEPRVQG